MEGREGGNGRLTANTGASRTDLHQVTGAGLAHLSLGELLESLLERVLRLVEADTAAILLLSEDEPILEVRAAKGLEEERLEAGFKTQVGSGFAGQVVAARQPMIVDDLRSEDDADPFLIQHGVRSLLGVPLIVEQRLVGVLQLGSLVPRRFTNEAMEVVQVAADRAALAVEYNRLWTAERRARTEAEAMATRVQNLQLVTEAALAYLTLEDLLEELLVRVAQVLETDTAAILLLTEDGETLAARAAKGLEEEVEHGFTIPVGAGFAGRVAAERRPVVLDSVGPRDVLNPILLEKGVRSLLGVPLVVEQHLVGVLHVGTLTPRKFTADDIDFLQAVADRAALAIERDQLLEAQRLTRAVQESLLPPGLPALPGLALAARYQPAAEISRVGGDWYDVIRRPDGVIGLAIGDVVGHGIESATVMGHLRNALRAYALDTGEPGPTVEKLSRFARELPGRPTATCLYGVFDPLTGEFRYASAGHPPPLIVAGPRRSRFGRSANFPPLGALAGGSGESELRLDEGETVLLYTDGLIERRGESLLDGQQRLQSMAETSQPEPLCSAVLSAVGDDADDDIAVLALQLEPVRSSFHHTVPAEPGELVSVRRFLARWLKRHDADPHDIEAITLACGEACANAIEHAYRPHATSFEVSGRSRSGTIEIEVRDSGSWRPPRGIDRGRGVPLMKAMMDEVRVSSDPKGTTITMRYRLKARDG